VVRHQNALLSVGASGTPPLLYQWQLLATNLPGATNATLTLSNVELTQAGPYRVTVFNAAAVVTSAVAMLTVLNPPTITAQPQSKVIAVGTNVTFTVTANGNGPLQYQWRYNGSPIPGATGSSLTLFNVQEQQSGDYTAMVTDSVGSVVSQPASLLAAVRPVITASPQSITAVVGDTVTLRVSANGTLPLGYRWRRNGSTYTNFLLYSHTSVLTLANVQLSQAANYSAVVSNVISIGVATSNATLTVLADSDGDHMADVWETIAGTDPNDPLSYLKIDRLRVANLATLTFSTVSNRTYAVQYHDQLDAGPWSTLTNVAARLTNHVEVIVDPQSSPARYYRLMTPGPP